MLSRRKCLALLAGAPLAPATAEVFTPAWNKRLVAAAMRQIGVTLAYDPGYAKIGFPGGDEPRERGVCTDVVIRAYRDAFGLDLQAQVNADMRGHFSKYLKLWGLPGPDANIDHRRAPNLRAFFARMGASLPASVNFDEYRPGGLVAHALPDGRPHIVIVAESQARSGAPAVNHNIGAGVRLEDTLSEFKITGRYRYAPA